ncbi:MAG: hypothetical protein LBH75_08580 [Treponema sp.]|jgi:hypothetical protein|nr:hypothetical protein [Treponema sp.]
MKDTGIVESLSKENEAFARLQEEYIRQRDADKVSMDKALAEMYKICVRLAHRYIAGYRRSKTIYLDLKEKSHDAAMYCIEQYLSKADFRIEKIGVYIRFGCRKVLFQDKERETREVEYEKVFM